MLTLYLSGEKNVSQCKFLIRMKLFEFFFYTQLTNGLMIIVMGFSSSNFDSCLCFRSRF